MANGTKYSQEQLIERARQRAAEENLHSFQVERGRLYLVKSRKLRPGTYHMVRVHWNGQITCDCPGWERWSVCAHQQTVAKRLEREAARRQWWLEHQPMLPTLEESPDGPEDARAA
ncbi:MAG: hypothetical protein M3281_08575 [Chloroflexota bacterium]|nr:hypothetical protein [Chloroflexota bacterium]